MEKISIKLAFIAVALMSLFFVGSSLAGEKGKLHVYFMDPDPRHVQAAQDTADEYMKDNPGTEITLEVCGFGTFLAKAVAAKAAGNPPDVLYTIPGHMWTFQQRGWLEAVDEVIERLGGDNFFQPLPGYTKVDGHYWGVPFSSYTMHLEYRKDLFDKKGLKEPKTWDDLLTAAKALTEDLDGDGKIDRYGIALPGKREYLLGIHFLGYLWGNGGHVLDKEGNVVFNSPETIQTLEFMKELYKYAPPGVANYSWMELSTTYVTEKVAITTNSVLQPLGDAINANNETVALNTAVAPIPTRLASQNPKARWSNMGWMIMKGTKNLKLAKDFLTFYFQPTSLIRFYHSIPVYSVPGEIPVIESKEYWSNDEMRKYKAAIEEFIENNKTGVDPAMEHPGILQPNTSVINQRLLIAECVQEVIFGNLPPQEAVAKAHRKMEGLIAKQK